MSVEWTKEMAEEFLAKSSPDPMFPCSTAENVQGAYDCSNLTTLPSLRDYIGGPTTARSLVVDFALRVLSDEKSAYDAQGRCSLKCANCNCRMLFNQLECVKADLETTKETLQETKSELHSTKEILQVTANERGEAMEELYSVKRALEECKKERNEEKRKFASAIAKMVQSEMSDVRTQLSALNLCLKEELGEKALEKKAASEAAKAALSASNDITLRLLMF